MAQETASLDNSKLAKSFAIDWKRGGLRWKIGVTFTSLILGAKSQDGNDTMTTVVFSTRR